MPNSADGPRGSEADRGEEALGAGCASSGLEALRVGREERTCRHQAGPGRQLRA